MANIKNTDVVFRLVLFSEKPIPVNDFFDSSFMHSLVGR
jgi:hypothetical protein